jgi:hypothetical protein
MHLFCFALKLIWIRRCPNCRRRRSIHLILIRSIHPSFRSCPNDFHHWIHRRRTCRRPALSHRFLTYHRSPIRRSFHCGPYFRCRRYSPGLRCFHHRSRIRHPFHHAILASRWCYRGSHRRTRCSLYFRNCRGCPVLTATRFLTATHFRTSIHYRTASHCPIASLRFPSRLIHSCRPIHPSRPEMSLTRPDCFCSGPS